MSVAVWHVEKFSNWEDVNEAAAAIGDLRTDGISSPYKNKGGDQKYRKAWTHTCEISQNEFNRVYQCLRLQLEEKATTAEKVLGLAETASLLSTWDKELADHKGTKKTQKQTYYNKSFRDAKNLAGPMTF
nr:arginine--trna ligase, cytoplasmic [Quercus suber]